MTMYAHIRFLDGTELALPMRGTGDNGEVATKLPCRARLEYVAFDGPHFAEEPSEEDVRAVKAWASTLAESVRQPANG